MATETSNTIHIVIAAVALAVLVAACGQATPESEQPTTTPSTTEPQEVTTTSIAIQPDVPDP